MENATFTLTRLIAYAKELSTGLVALVQEWFNFFSANDALMWVFAVGVILLAVKLIKGFTA